MKRSNYVSTAQTAIYNAKSGDDLYNKIQSIYKTHHERRYWGVFQYGASYWGGHVAVVDAKDKSHKGTGWYSNWPKQDAFWFY